LLQLTLKEVSFDFVECSQFSEPSACTRRLKKRSPPTFSTPYPQHEDQVKVKKVRTLLADI